MTGWSRPSFILESEGLGTPASPGARDAENWGAKQKKKGIAPTYSWGIGTANEFSVGLYHLESDSRPLYNHPWVLDGNRIVPVLPAKNYYGLSSDKLETSATYATLGHIRRFADGAELKTRLRYGEYERDLWASAIGFCNNTVNCPGQTITRASQVNGNTVLNRTPKGRRGSSDIAQVQSDYSDSFDALGKRHNLIAGVDLFMENAKCNNNFTGGAL